MIIGKIKLFSGVVAFVLIVSGLMPLGTVNAAESTTVTISVESSPGEGTTFTINIPVHT